MVARDRVGFKSVRGTITPEIIAGRPPSGANQIALGAATLDELGKKVGDRSWPGPDGSHDYRVVGRAVFPKLDEPQPLANGALSTRAGLERLLSERDTHNGSAYLIVRTVAGRYPRPSNTESATIPDVERPFGPTVPVEVDRLRRVDWLPATSRCFWRSCTACSRTCARHQCSTDAGRELAVLKTLGFDRRQVRATVVWQATTLATVGLVLGIPMGVLVGALVWRQVASGLGVVTTAPLPVLALIAIVPCVLVAVNVIAFLPARGAARTRPAVALRAE